LDSIEFVVGEVDLGNGTQDCAEPLINGESLVDILARVEGRLGYAGLAPEDLSRVLTRVESEGRAQVLGLREALAEPRRVAGRLRTSPQ
jgi:hypothetical protein